MAIARLSALLSSLKGSIGALTASRWRGGTRLSCKPPARSAAAPAMLDHQALLAQAARAWAALSDSDRQAWQPFTAPGQSTFNVYISAWLRQSGFTPPVPPVPPTNQTGSTPIMGRYHTLSNNLYLTSLSRELRTEEGLIIRSSQPRPLRYTTPSRTLASCVTNFHGSLGTFPNLGVVAATPNPTFTLNGSFALTSPWTLEIWFKPDSVSNVNRSLFACTGYWPCLWFSSVYACVVFWSRATEQRTATPTFHANQWNFVALVSGPETDTIRLYVNGAYAATWTGLANTSIVFPAVFMTSYGWGAPTPGALGPVRLSSTSRDAAALDHAWNDGVGALWPVDPDTVRLFPTNAFTEGVWRDLSPAAVNGAINQTSITPGPGAQLLIAGASTPYPAPRRSLVQIQPWFAADALMQDTKELVTW